MSRGKLWKLFLPPLAHSLNRLGIVSRSSVLQVFLEHLLWAGLCSRSGDAALNKTDHAPSALERIPYKASEEPSEDFFFSSQIDIHFHAEFYILFFFFNCFSKQGPQI